MLTMRPMTKMAKPPPPVPPRPSKTIVAEALAKRRMNLMEESNNTVPIRLAPPPPSGNLNRTNSTISIKKNNYERTISEELNKSNSRTVIFQSSNMKNSNNKIFKSALIKNEPSNKPCLEETFNNKNNNKSVVEDVIVTTKNNLNASSELDNNDGNRIKIKQFRKKKDESSCKSNCSDDSSIASSTENILSFVINEEKQAERFNVNVNVKEDQEGTLGNTFVEEKWDEMDKNHVNMLIDEMFASVLEVSKNVESNDDISNNRTISTEDNTTITKINGSCDNQQRYESSVETNGLTAFTTTTVLIIEGDDDKVVESSNFFDGSKLKGSLENVFASQDSCSNSSTMEKKSVQFDDKKNAELLIEELECMRLEQEKILRRQKKPSQEIYDEDVGNNGCECVEDFENVKNDCRHVLGSRGCTIGGAALDYERLKTMSSLHGLPPLPKSLSSFNLNENYVNPPTPLRTTSIRSHQVLPPTVTTNTNPFITHNKGVNGLSEVQPAIPKGRKSTSLDAQLAILKREMYSLRQLDLSLLSQLWSLNESIQDFRQILQEQEDCRGVLSPPSPSPPPSSCDEGEGEEQQFYMNAPPKTTPPLAPSLKFRPAPPPPPPARRSSNSSNASTGC